MDISFFNLIYCLDVKSLKIASMRLADYGLRGKDFFITKYIFLLIDIPIGGPISHASLAVISGVQKTISLYNS